MNNNNDKKFISPLISISILLIAGIGLFFSINYYNINLSKAQDYIKSENSVVATFINDYFTELIHFAETFANDKDFINAEFSKESEKKVLEVLKNYQNSNKNIAYIYAGYRNKKIVINDWTVPEGFDPTIRPWYKEGIKSSKKVYIGTPYRDIKTKEWLVSTGKALINDNNEVVGVLSIDCSIKQLIDLINKDISYKTGQTFVTNKNGIIILHKNLNFINNSFFENLNIFSGKNGIIKTTIDSKKYFVAYNKLDSTGWYVFTLVENNEVMAPVIKGVLSFSLISITLLIVFVFLESILFSNFKLKKLVEEKTKELKEKNKKIMDSIYYSKNIQTSILPLESDLKKKFKDFFILWKPANIVSGDFYWFKEKDDGSFYISVIDCTGHGVPGALMTMTANSLLYRIIDDMNIKNPKDILKELNILFKETINANNADYRIDDGLEIGLCYIIPKQNKIIYSGAGISLYYSDNNEIIRIKGNSQGIGYKRSKVDYEYNEYHIEIKKSMSFYLITDGYEDQNNKDKKRFGRKNLVKLIDEIHFKPMNIQKKIFEKTLKDFMNGEEQRDDITILGFKL
jgi:serine phosphatase RsbU (regulator of sigma subunit)